MVTSTSRQLKQDSHFKALFQPHDDRIFVENPQGDLGGGDLRLVVQRLSWLGQPVKFKVVDKDAHFGDTVRPLDQGCPPHLAECFPLSPPVPLPTA